MTKDCILRISIEGVANTYFNGPRTNHISQDWSRIFPVTILEPWEEAEGGRAFPLRRRKPHAGGG